MRREVAVVCRFRSDTPKGRTMRDKRRTQRTGHGSRKGTACIPADTPLCRQGTQDFIIERWEHAEPRRRGSA